MVEMANGKHGNLSGAGPNGDAALRVKQLEEELRRVHGAVVLGLNQLLDLKDLKTGSHSTRLAEWAVRVAIDLGLNEDYQRNVEVASILHDIGKIGVADSILNKKGPLTASQKAAMDRHPEYGWAILRLLPGFELASLFTLHHHERFDGSGYPGGLKRDEIPLGARIVTVVDAFDAMVSDRPYRPALSLDDAITRLQEASGTDFDPDIVGPFVELGRESHDQVRALTQPAPDPLEF
jgi:HD-GYP domain-containing protein (c-di-GMP phosphodiesterase class II)